MNKVIADIINNKFESFEELSIDQKHQFLVYISNHQIKNAVLLKLLNTNYWYDIRLELFNMIYKDKNFIHHTVTMLANNLVKFKELTDEQIITDIKNGDEQALVYLLNKYKDLVNSKVGKYFIIGAEREDIVQEGMIGLFKAIKGFDNTKQNTFKTFANICIERQLITAIKSSNRQKHMPLNSYLSLNTSAYEDDEDGTELIETFNNTQIEDPLDTITKKEYFEEIQNSIHKNLSKFEEQVLQRFIQGESYEVIAKKLDTPVKSIDNAIQRIRKKAIKNFF